MWNVLFIHHKWSGDLQYLSAPVGGDKYAHWNTTNAEEAAHVWQQHVESHGEAAAE